MNLINDTPAPVPSNKQATAGIIAAITSFAGILCLCLSLGINAYLSSGAPRPYSINDTLINLSNIALYAAALVGLAGGVISLVSLFQKNRKKVFGIIGLALSVLILCGVCGALAWGFLQAK